MTRCETIAVKSDGERNWWGCVKCGRTSRSPTRSAPVFTCLAKSGGQFSAEQLQQSLPRSASSANTAAPSPRCVHFGRLHVAIPTKWLDCGCGSVRLHECRLYGDLATERPISAAGVEALSQLEPTYKRNCVACRFRNRRLPIAAGASIVLADTSLGDVVLNCWYPQARQNTAGNYEDAVRMLGRPLTTDPGENLAELWQPELRSREPRIDFRARWFGLTEIRRPTVRLDPEAVAWAKTLREPGRKLVVLTVISHNAREREWPAENCRAFGEIMASKGIQVILDLSRPNAALQAGPWRTLVGEPIPRLFAMLAEADLLVSIDSGPAHVAGTLDRPVLLMMGPMIDPSYEHMGSVQTIRSGLACGGCNLQHPWGPQCHGGCAAMRDLSAESVAARAMRMLTPTNIGVCTLATDRLADVRDITRPPLEAYCRRHDYRLHALNQVMDFQRPPSWSKILMLQRWLSEHEWIWWVDADAVVTAPERRLEELTDGATGDLLIASDQNGINNGSFLLRNCPWSHDFLRRVWETTEPLDHHWWEQWATMKILEANPADRAHVQGVRKRSINAYQSDWRPGDFVLHTPGTPDRVRVLRDAVSGLA